MGSRYVSVSREAMVGLLEKMGFSQYHGRGTGGELVYCRHLHVDQTMLVKVYTSLPVNAGDARACGEDAIRVMLVFENEHSKASGCLYKASRVFRTGSEQAVLERVLERARECYAAGLMRHQGKTPEQIKRDAPDRGRAKKEG